MFGLGRLTAAIARLAGALDALADTTEVTNAGLRARLGLDGHVRGDLIDGRADALPGPDDAAEGQEEASNGRRRGRKGVAG